MPPKSNNFWSPIMQKIIASVLGVLLTTTILAAFTLEKRVSFLEYEGRSTKEIVTGIDRKLKYILCSKYKEDSYCD